MQEIFEMVVTMSLQGIVIFGIVFPVRFLLKKLHISHKYIVALWFVLFFYLFFPWKVELPVGFWNNEVTEDTNEFLAQQPMLYDNLVPLDVDTNINADTSNDKIIQTPQGPVFKFEKILSCVWATVTGCLYIHLLYSYILIRKRLVLRTIYKENIFLAEDIQTPMVFGIVRPKVFLPIGIEQENLKYVIAHENMHIKRKDALWKILAYMICLIHWFNPMVWLAYYLLGGDIEKACDEAVIRQLGEENKKDYAGALLQAAEGTLYRKKKVFVAPICFDEGDVKGRIKNIVKYKYTLPIVGSLVIIGAVILAVIFMTDTKTKAEEKQEEVQADEESVIEEESEGEDKVLKTLEATLTDGEKLTLSVIGKQNDFSYGVREIIVYKGATEIQSILMEEAINEEGLIGIEEGYTESATLENLAQLKDINFDGYMDLEVGACWPNNSIPYYYWCWNPDKQQFEYVFCLQLIGIDEAKKQLIEWKKIENGLYHTYYYRIYEDNSLELVDTQVEDVRPQPNPKTEGQEDLGTGQYLKDIDWENVATRISEEEAEALQAYRSVLEGEEFIWIYRSGEGEEPDTYTHAQKQLTIQEMLDEELRLNEIEPQDAVVDSFLFADVFQSGKEDICLLFRHLGWYWLILHEDNGVIYGIDMPVRWFQGVQKDGLYYGSGGAGVSYYQRMTFENGDYIETDVGDVINGELFIDDVKQSEAIYQQWREDNLKEEVKWYKPVE